jgi:hypothetical protein
MKEQQAGQIHRRLGNRSNYISYILIRCMSWKKGEQVAMKEQQAGQIHRRLGDRSNYIHEVRGTLSVTALITLMK